MNVDWGIDTGFSGASHSGTWEIDQAAWDAMTPEERDTMLNEFMQDEIANHIEPWWKVREETNDNHRSGN